jgi:hypothetical protein
MRSLAPSRRTTRMTGLIGACTLAVLALSGCIRVDADLTVNSDATGSGTFAFELQKDAAGFLGISDLDTFRSELVEGDLSDESGLGVFESCDASESDAAFVYSCTFTDAAFTDPAEGPWTIAKDGDSIVFTMKSDSQGDATATESDDLLGDASLGSINVDVTFPGAITAITGTGGTKTSDTTATVSGSLTETIDVTITSEAGSGGLAISALLVVLLAVAVIALLVIVVVVLIMRRRGSSQPAGDAADGAATDLTGAGAAATGAAAAAAAVPVLVDETPTEVVDVVETVEAVEVAEVVETVETPTEVAEVVETVEDPAATDEQPRDPA